jgi:hypothetical protein
MTLCCAHAAADSLSLNVGCLHDCFASRTLACCLLVACALPYTLQTERLARASQLMRVPCVGGACLRVPLQYLSCLLATIDIRPGLVLPSNAVAVARVHRQHPVCQSGEATARRSGRQRALGRSPLESRSLPFTHSLSPGAGASRVGARLRCLCVRSGLLRGVAGLRVAGHEPSVFSATGREGLRVSSLSAVCFVAAH